MINLPSINSRDTAFTRELKTAIIELEKQLRRQRIRGDGATFSVTGTGGGLVGHAKKTAQSIIAKITGAPTAGVYPVALYANGIDGDSTGTGTAAPLNLSIHETIPVNTWIIVTPKAYTEVES